MMKGLNVSLAEWDSVSILIKFSTEIIMNKTGNNHFNRLPKLVLLFILFSRNLSLDFNFGIMYMIINSNTSQILINY